MQGSRGLESFFRCIEWRWWKNEVRSSFSSKVIPLGKTRKVRKSPFFAPKTEVFLVVVVTASTVAAIVASAVTWIVLTRVALAGPLRKRRGNCKGGGVV